MPLPQWMMADMSVVRASLRAKIDDRESQRKLVLIIVCVALFLDNMLYMVIVPIIPEFLRQIDEYGNTTDIGGSTVSSSSSSASHHFLSPITAVLKGGGKHVLTNTLLPSQQFPATSQDLSNTTMSPAFTFNMIAPPVAVTPAPMINSTTNRTDIIGNVRIPVFKGPESTSVGFLFASKAMVQIFIGPIAGWVIDRHGYDRPMFFGLVVIFFSTIMFAFGGSYGALFFARSLQGVGSAFADTSGLAMIADRYNDDETQRSRALGIALAFISFGCLFAPPFGGVLFDLFGKVVPFLTLALIALIDGAAVLFVMAPDRQQRGEKADNVGGPEPTPMWKLFLDPYIAIAAGALAMSNVSLAFLEPTIAMWMKETMDAAEWQMGIIWFPGFFPHICGVFLVVIVVRIYPQYQWLIALCGLALEGFSCLFIPLAKSFWGLIIPIMMICFGIACVDTSLLPMLGYLVDKRHTSVYGSVYAIADISYSLAYAVGPILAGGLVTAVGFTWLNVFTFIVTAGFAPLLWYERYNYEAYQPLGDGENSGGGKTLNEFNQYSNIDGANTNIPPYGGETTQMMYNGSAPLNQQGATASYGSYQSDPTVDEQPKPEWQNMWQP